MDDTARRSGGAVRVELTIRTALVGIAAVAAVWLFLQLWQILLVVVGGLMFVGMLNPFVDRLEQRGMKRTRAIGLVFLALFVVAGGFAALTFPQIARQGADLAHRFPELQVKVAERLEKTEIAAPLARSIRGFDQAEIARRAGELGWSYGPKVAEVLAYTVAALFLALYVMLDRDRMRGSLFSVVPRRYHLRLSRVLLNLETIVGGYMRGQAITSALMTAFTFVVLVAFGVPNALALALFAGVADVLPYVGALLACGPAVIAALPKGTTTALVVLAILAAYQEIESRIIVPRIYGRVLRLPAATVLVALLVGGKLLGILGALLALPIAAAIRMMISEMRVALPGDAAPDEEQRALRAQDARAEAEFAERAAGQPAREAAAIATEIAAERHEEIAEEKGEEAVVSAPITSGAR